MVTANAEYNPNRIFKTMTWELIGKEYQSTEFMNDRIFIPTAPFTLNEVRLFRTEGYMFARMSMSTTANKNMAGTVLGTFDLDKIGIIPPQERSMQIFLNVVAPGNSHGIAALELQTGKLTGDTSYVAEPFFKANRNAIIWGEIPVINRLRMDSACNRFYWKRIT